MRSQRLKLSAVTLALFVLAAAIFVGGAGSASGDNNGRVRWDIAQLSGAPPSIHILPGGSASAMAQHGNRITVTGTGTFRPGESSGVTGGGTWATTGPDVGTHNGTFKVTRLVSFELAPGSLPSPPFIDDIAGHPENARAGLAVLQVAYSDGSNGVLAVSCDLPSGSPDSIFEGITASKGFVDFWNREAPFPTSPPFVLGANGNRTQFRVLPGDEDND